MTNKHIQLLKSEMCPATGCTEPISIAYGASILRKEFDIDYTKIENIYLSLSLNVFKNALGVGIPGTNLTGIPIAFALGLIAGNSDKLLDVLADIKKQDIETSTNFIDENKINIDIETTPQKLFIKIIVETLDNKYSLVIEENHTNIVHLSSKNQIKINKKNNLEFSEKKSDIKTSILEIFNFIKTISIKEIEFLNESINLNKKISEEGINNNYGLEVGKTIFSSNQLEKIDVKSYITSMTSAASDARMGGCQLPVMTNCGSGNQGITTSLPVIYFGEYFNFSKENILRAIALSNLVAIHLKQKLGKLSALCGVIISAIGASCGMVFLKGGDINNINFAIKNMIGNVSGIICDGAKNSCALKVATVTEAAYNSMCLALKNKCVSSIEGIIDEDIEKTINNLISLGKIGMEETDKLILNIMLSK